MVLEYLRVLPSCCGYLGVSLAAAAVALAVFAASFGPLGPYDDNAYISAAAMRALETAHEPPRTRLFNDTLAYGSRGAFSRGMREARACQRHPKILL